MAWWKSIIFFLVVTSLPVAVRADGLFCELTVHIMPERKIVAGTARLRADSDRRVRIWTPRLSRIHIDGRPVADLADLKTALFFAEPDRPVVLRIQRNGNVLEKSIQLTWDESPH